MYLAMSSSTLPLMTPSRWQKRLICWGVGYIVLPTELLSHVIQTLSGWYKTSNMGGMLRNRE